MESSIYPNAVHMSLLTDLDKSVMQHPTDFQESNTEHSSEPTISMFKVHMIYRSRHTRSVTLVIWPQNDVIISLTVLRCYGEQAKLRNVGTGINVDLRLCMI
jgi:hypothetical protein